MSAEGKQDLDDYLMVLTCVVIVLCKTNMFAFRVSVCAVEQLSLSVTNSIERSRYDRPTSYSTSTNHKSLEHSLFGLMSTG